MTDVQAQARRDDALIDQAIAQLDERFGTTDIWERPLDLRSLLFEAPPSIEWLVENHIPLGRGFLLTGLGGSSKTQFVRQIANGCAIGRLPWNWRIPITGKSVLVLTEDTTDDVHRALYNTCMAMRLTRDEIRLVSDSVICYALAGVDIKLLANFEGRDLRKTEIYHALVDRIKREGDVVFVAIDPALSITTGDELDQGHQRALGKMIDDLAVQTNAAACLVSHATKASLQAEELSSHNSRGGGAITDAVRAEFALRTMTAAEAQKAGISDLEERKRHVQLVATKGNHLPPSAYVPVWLRRGDNGVLSGSDISFSDNDDTLSHRHFLALHTLREMCEIHVPKLDEWRAECVERKIITATHHDARKKSMQRIVKALVADGLIEHGVGRGVYVPTCQDQGT